MEVNTQRRGQGLREKIPDIKKTLEMVKFLKMRRKVSLVRSFIHLPELCLPFVFLHFLSFSL
jgi:hypothetical protein